MKWKNLIQEQVHKKELFEQVHMCVYAHTTDILWLFCNNEIHAGILFIKKKTLSYHRLDIYGNKLFTFVHKSLAKFEIFYRELSDPDLTNVITTPIVFPNLSYNWELLCI